MSSISTVLCNNIYPMLADQEPVPQALIDVIRIAAGYLAEARGLSADALPVPAILPSAVRPTLDSLAWHTADVRLLGDVYADLRHGRHAQGSYYTPRALADQVVRWAINPDASRILDPAMGAGHLLLSAAEYLAGIDADSAARWQALEVLYGADSDPGAVEVARITLWLWAAHPGTTPDDLASHLVCANSLIDEVWSHPFDAVIGNPPYASVFTRAHDTDNTAAIAARHETASGSYDLSVPFVERALHLTREGGCCALVLPNKLLAADYARPLREWLSQTVIVERIADYSDAHLFAAEVYPIVCVFRRNAPRPDDRLHVSTQPDPLAQANLRGAPGMVWSPVLANDFAEMRRCWQGNVRPLGDVAEIAAGLTVGEAYALQPAVIEAPPNLLPSGFVPLVTTGLVHRHCVMWGKTRTQFLKRTFRHPVVALHALPLRRREQAAQRKIIVAGMGLTPRAVLDRGNTLASVATLIITRSEWPLGALCAWLNSEVVARLYRVLFSGLALSGGYLRFGKRELAHLPIPNVPADDPRVSHLDALGWQALDGSIAEAEINSLVRSLYGLDALTPDAA